MAKDDTIVIKDWQSGIAPSPYLGFAYMQNVSPTDIPGLLVASPAAEKKSSTTITGVPKYAVQDSDNYATVYVVDSDHKVYSSTAQTNYATWTLVTHASASTGGGNGLVLYKDHLILFGNTKADIYGPLSSSPSWTNDWKTLALTSGEHYAMVGADDIIYFGNGNAVASLSSLAAGSPPTATYNAAALNLPNAYTITSIVQFGSRLMIGTYYGSASNVGRPVKADIFPWFQAGSPSFDNPIRIPEDGINQMVNINNTLYIQAGRSGNYYISNGSSTRKLFSIPKGMKGINSLPVVNTYPGGIMYFQNRLFTACTVTASSGAEPNASGVYSVNLDGTNLVNENTLSVTSVNTPPAITNTIKLLFPATAYAYLIGWYDSTATAQGIDVVGTGNDNSGYNAFVESAVYPVGTATAKRTFTYAEVYLNRPLASGQGVRLAYRTDTSASYTTIATIDYATYGAIQSFPVPFGVTTEQIQFKISLTGTTSPQLREVRCL